MSITAIEIEILKYEKKGFKISQRRKLKHGLRIYLKRKWEKTFSWGFEGIYIYYVEGNCTTDSLHECFKDYAKFYEDEEFDEGDKGFYICNGNLDSKIFTGLRKVMIDNEDIRRSIKPITFNLALTEEKGLEDRSKKKIFVVHGRDKAPAFELQMLLNKELGLEVIRLEEQPHHGKTIIEKLEAYSDVGYVFVIVTPDDMGALKGEKPRERTRQNVIFEWGHFEAKIGREKICVLLKGDIELPSDMHGIGYHGFTESIEEVFLKIKRELEEAGFI